MEFLIKTLMTIVATTMVCRKEMVQIYNEVKASREDE